MSLLYVCLLVIVHIVETTNCSMWYHSMPESIVCQEGTRFSTACQVKAPCGMKVNVLWYWSPENTSNSTGLVTDSSNARIRALHFQAAPCTNNSVMVHYFYTLTLAGLSSRNAGLYWCQLKITEEEGSSGAVSNLLPSDKCYVGVDDTLTGCEYGEHTDEWKCAQSKDSASPGGSEVFYSDVLITIGGPFPTVAPQNTNGDNPPIRMQFTIMEVTLFGVVLLCIATMSLLLVCLFCRHRRKRTGETTISCKHSQGLYCTFSECRFCSSPYYSCSEN